MKTKTVYAIIAMGALAFPLFLLRDLTPGNEMKYISIVNEALNNGRLFVFYNHDVPYADKPPLYFWLIMAVKLLTGNYNAPAIGAFSLIPAILILVVMSRWTSQWLDENEQILASAMLFSTALFFGGALVLRMDMLMAFFITMALYNFYRCYNGTGRPFEPYLVWAWMFLALFTKGPLGVLVPLLSILVFLVREKKISDIRKYLPLSGLAVFALLVTIWLLFAYLEGGKDYFYDLTVNQTAGRAIHPPKHKQPLYYYLEQFPAVALPWSLMYFFTFVLGLKDRDGATVMEKFFQVVILSTLVLLSLLRGKLEIYSLPIYPFLAFLTLLHFKRLNRKKYWKWCLAAPALVFVFLFPGLIAADFFKMLPVKINALSYAGGALCLAAGVYGMKEIMKGRFNRAVWAIMGGFLIPVFFLFYANSEKINSEMGLRIIAEKGKAACGDFACDRYYAFNMNDAVNMDIYLGKDVALVKDAAALKEAIKQNVIIFARKKDITVNNRLRDALGNSHLVFETGSMAVYHAPCLPP